MDKAECTRVNVHGTTRLLNKASVAGCKWFIFGSSREVYGEPTSFPVREEDGVNPINHYGHAKVEGERMVSEHCEQHGMAHSNLRFSNVYGHPRDHPTRLVNAFLRRALKSEPLKSTAEARCSTSPISTILCLRFSTQQKYCMKSEFLSHQSTYCPEHPFQLKTLPAMSWKSPVASPTLPTPKVVTTTLSGSMATRAGFRNCSGMNAMSTFAQVWSGVQTFSEIILQPKRVILNEGFAGDSRIPSKVQCRI